MSGQGKYTDYAPPASDKNTLLAKLFRKGSPSIGPTGGPLDQTHAKEAAIKIATGKVDALGVGGIQPSDGVQAGDKGHFPAGVDLDFTGKLADVQPPDTAEGKSVKWTNPGDPANSYVPDITSPGPGRTEGIDKDADPVLAVKDLKPNYVPAAPGTGTKSPTATNAKVIAANILGVTGKLGNSGANS